MHAQLTLGMTTYNSEMWLPRALTSVLGQTFENFELLISDNRSNDGTWDLLQSYAHNDKRIKLFRQPRNIGPMLNANFVLSQGKLPFFKWTLSNDYLAPEYLTRCMSILVQDPSLIGVHSRTYLIGDDGLERPDADDQFDLTDPDPIVRYTNFLKNVRLNHLLQGVFRREALLEAGYLKPLSGHDVVYVASLALIGRIYQIPERLFYRSVASGTISNSCPRKAAAWHQSRRAVLLGTNARILASKWEALSLHGLTVANRLRLLSSLIRTSRWTVGGLAEDADLFFRYLRDHRHVL